MMPFLVDQHFIIMLSNLKGFDNRIQSKILTMRFSHQRFLETKQLIKINVITVKNTNT